MYVVSVPNRDSPPAILLRESFREDGKVKNRTLANLTGWSQERVEALRRVLKGRVVVQQAALLSESFEIIRSRPHGHVAAVVGTIRRLGLDKLLAPKPTRERQLTLAMIVERIVSARSKLATARGLDPETLSSSLAEILGVEAANEDALYDAMDWAFERQSTVENALAKRHLADGGLVLYDLSSTYFEGRHCPLAKLGHSRDGKKDKLQIVFGLLTNAEGCPVAVEVFEGNTGDPKTLLPQVKKLRERFGIARMVLVGDRGMITEARIRDDLEPVEGLDWITALRAPAIQGLVQGGALQLSLFDKKDLAEIRSPDFPGERLIVCRNPLLADERARKRKELLLATEKELAKIVRATERKKNPLRGKAEIGLRAGKVIARRKMGKHFKLTITEASFSYRRKEDSILRESQLDGFYVVRTTVPEARLPAEEVVRSYKRLATVERAFRSMKTVDLKVRPIHHRLEKRVRTHVFLCMLAYYVEWHMRQALAPMLFDDEHKDEAHAARASIVAPAQRSVSAKRKALLKQNEDGQPVHSFRTLLEDLATLAKNRVQPKNREIPAFDLLTTPTTIQRRAIGLLRVALAS